MTAKGAHQFPGQRGDFSTVDNTARGRARARLRVVRRSNAYTPNVSLEIPSVTAKGALQLPGQHGDFSVVDNTARARARLRVVRCGNRRARRRPMFTWISHRPPLKGNFRFQSLMETFRLWIIQRARLRVVRCGNRRARRGPMLTWKSNRSPLRAHFSSQANMATFRLWIIQPADARARARTRASARCTLRQWTGT